MKAKTSLSLLLILSVVLLSSCRSVPKGMTYLEDMNIDSIQYLADSYNKYEPVIKHNDQLLITVSSPVLNQEQVAQFNLPMNTYLAPGETTMFQSAAIQTYTVDKEGNINFPVIGRIGLAGLTRSQAVNYIGEKVKVYLESPIVNLQIISFKVTVLGEVLQPGTIKVTDERISVFEALGAAGDMTIYGNRKNVKLIRDNNGDKETAILDLTKNNIFSSPYYYLQQNDILYVEPNDTKKKESTYGTTDSYRLNVFSITFSAIAIIANVVIAYITRNKN